MLIVDSRLFSNVYLKVGNPKVSNEDRIYTPKSSLTNIFFFKLTPSPCTSTMKTRQLYAQAKANLLEKKNMFLDESI